MTSSSSSQTSGTAESQSNEVRQVGRGAAWIMAAKLWFILSGMGLLFILPRIGAATEEARAALFGTYSVIVGVVNPITMMLITGTLQAVSKFVSENPTHYRAVTATVLKLQSIFGVVVAGGFAIAAPIIADLLNDPSMTNPLRLAAVIIFLYALYPVFIGGFNGLRLFHLQAMMDICFATLKIGLILGLVYVGYGVMGAIGGFATTALVLTATAGVLTVILSRERKAEPVDIGIKRILRFEIWIMIFALASNLLLNADLYIVKALSLDQAAVGVYSACLQMARLPYVAVISITFVLFPLISHATFSEDIDTARSYIATATRYSLLIVGLMALSLAALSRDLLMLVFPPLYASGYLQLLFLSVAYLGFSLLAIFATIITSAGKPEASTLIVVVTLALSSGLAAAGMYSGGPDFAAAGVMIAMLAGAGSAMWFIHRWLKPVWPWATIIRLGICGASVIFASLFWSPDNKVLIVAKAVAVFVAFLLGLFLLKEFTQDDLGKIKKIVARS